MERTIAITSTAGHETPPASDAMAKLKPLLSRRDMMRLTKSSSPAHVFFMPDGSVIVDFIRGMHLCTAVVPQPAYERNDCSVRAVSNVFGVPYETVHKAFADVGRVSGHGADIAQVWKVASSFGAKRLVTRRQTLAAFVAKHQTGRWLVWTTGHVLAVVEGVVVDNKPSGRLVRVHGYWRCS